jgi:hypothetical protein
VWWNSKSYATKFDLHELNQNRKSQRRARLDNVSHRFIPNGVLSDAITKIMACRSKTLNICATNAIGIALVKMANGKTSIHNQSDMVAANLVWNSRQSNRLTKLILVVLNIEEDLANNVHVAFHKSVMWPNEKSSATGDLKPSPAKRTDSANAGWLQRLVRRLVEFFHNVWDYVSCPWLLQEDMQVLEALCQEKARQRRRRQTKEARQWLKENPNAPWSEDNNTTQSELAADDQASDIRSGQALEKEPHSMAVQPQTQTPQKASDNSMDAAAQSTEVLPQNLQHPSRRLESEACYYSYAKSPNVEN